MDHGFLMYITIEGPEATGKSTQCKALAARLKEAGYEVFLTKEPGSPHDQVCKGIRELLLNPDNKIESKAGLLLFLADRAQHIEKVKNELSLGKVVISDRSSLSSFVYYVAEKRSEVLDKDQFLCNMIDFAQQIRPDLCFICSSDLNWSLEKLSSRTHIDRIEKLSQGFHNNTHKLFSKEAIDQMCSMMIFSPKKVIHLPPASVSEKSDIASRIYKEVTDLL